MILFDRVRSTHSIWVVMLASGIAALFLPVWLVASTSSSSKSGEQVGKTTAQTDEPANSDLVFRHTCGELKRLVRAHLLAEVNDMRIALNLPPETVRKLQTVAKGTARLINTEEWGVASYRAMFKKADDQPFKTFRLQGRRVSLQSGEDSEVTLPELFPVAVWIELHEKRFVIGLRCGSFVRYQAEGEGLEDARSHMLWQKHVKATLTEAQIEKVREYQIRQRKAAAVEAILGIMDMETLLLPDQREPVRKWLEQKIKSPSWRNNILSEAGDSLHSVCSRQLRATAELTRILSPQQLTAWSQYRRVVKHSSDDLKPSGDSRKQILTHAIRSELEATAREDTIIRADEAAAILKLGEPEVAKLRAAVGEVAREFADSCVSEVYGHVETPFSEPDRVRINGRKLTLRAENVDATKQILHKVEFEILPTMTRVVVFGPKSNRSLVLRQGRVNLASWTDALTEVATPDQLRRLQNELKRKRQRALASVLLGVMTGAVRLDPQQQTKVRAWIATRLEDMQVVPDEFDHSILTELAGNIGLKGLDEILSEHQMAIWFSRVSLQSIHAGR